MTGAGVTIPDLAILLILRPSGHPVQPRNWPKRPRFNCIGLPHSSHDSGSSGSAVAEPSAVVASPFPLGRVTRSRVASQFKHLRYFPNRPHFSTIPLVSHLRQTSSVAVS